MKNVFIIGSKGIPAQYGGFETYVDNQVIRQKNYHIKYYVSCLSNESSEFEYFGATGLNVKVPAIGSAKAVLYDLLALKRSLDKIENCGMKNALIYILACRIGPFMWIYKRRLMKLGVKLYVNPDGHEWKRSKWNKIIRKYWKLSEKLMVKHADLLICDNPGIKDYIKTEYSMFSPNTEYIAYGADTQRASYSDTDPTYLKWMKDHEIIGMKYYLIVGRFVPENNYETMIREFIRSDTKKGFSHYYKC